MAKGFLVKNQINGTHFRISDYPLLPGDLIVKQQDGSWLKESPGITIGGFHLSEAQEAELEEVEFSSRGLFYQIHNKNGDLISE